MATLYPNHLQPSPQRPDLPPPGQRYQNRVYQPYVFQPNFLKQQMRQREMEKAAHLGQMGMDGMPSAMQMTLRDRPNHAANMGTLPQHMMDDAMNRKKSGRKVIDWTSSCAIYLERRRWQRDVDDVPALLPDTTYSIEMQATMAYKDSSASSIATKFVRSATNKMKCPVYKVVWTPDGRRLVTGSASGEFTLWNGTAFNFETILQAHDSPVRAMSWSHNDAWLITGDNQGYIKYWQLNMNNVKMYQAHKDQACRSVCFGPTDTKFVTASDDGTVRVWDFLRCHEEHILRGHGADVKQVDWHPQKCLVGSASKDLQSPVKLWDPRIGQSLATIHAHKGTVMDIKFNRNGNWFLTASRDHLIKLYDIRNLKEERQIFRGHKKEAFSIAWHPIHEDMFASGGSEGSIMFWQVGEDKEIGGLEGAHDSLIWSLAWHPLGHILVSGSNDHSTKFWTRNRPGDQGRDRYNLFPGLDDVTAAKAATSSNNDKSSEVTNIPGMGDTDAAAAEVAKREEEQLKSGIPGLDWSYEEKNEFDRKVIMQNENRKKIPYARPVPRSFAAAWESNKEGAPRRPSRSPSPHRYEYDEPPPPPPPAWRRSERPPPRIPRPPPGRDYGPPEDYPMDDRRPMMDYEPNHPPPPPDGRLPPMDYPPNHQPPRESRQPETDYGPNQYQDEVNFHEPQQTSRPMRNQVDDRPYDQDHNQTEYLNTQETDEYPSMGEEGNYPSDDMNHHPHAMSRQQQGRFGPRAPKRQYPPDSRVQHNEWSNEGPIPEEAMYSNDNMPLNNDAYYDELLAMDPNLQESLLANYHLEQEAMAYDNNYDMQYPHNAPPRGRGMHKPQRGQFRGRPGGPPRGRGRGNFRGGPRYPMGQGEGPRGRNFPPNRIRRGMRRPMYE